MTGTENLSLSLQILRFIEGGYDGESHSWSQRCLDGARWRYLYHACLELLLYKLQAAFDDSSSTCFMCSVKES